MFDFPNDVTDLNEVPEAYRSLYQPGEEGFTLDPHLAEKLDVSGLLSALEKERGNAQNFEKELKAWQTLGRDPETAWANKQKALTAEFTEQFDAILAEKDEEIARLKERNADFLITTHATEALLKAGGSVELLMPHIRAAVTLVEEEGAPSLRIIDTDGSLREKAEGVPLTVEDLVAEMRSSPVFARAFNPTGSKGSGMDPSGVPVNLATINGQNQWALNARIEDIAAGKVSVSM
ncbi:hypothetical protein [Sneathiella litorea]|uniref:Uncharacterized protein n=1 Tax=Sneathiella litorea TaxID=2606216 RepID=A0A6L8W717_9PROT|nr:hypothetical protein [Sneathiella litorea]MZR30905.1 hypothetical protein [Sneathiella litorea]